MPRGRWTTLLLDALQEHSVIEVSAVVEEHLGRPETRAERMASRRAAGRLADQGLAVRLYIATTARDGRELPHLHLARPATDQAVERPPDPHAHAYAHLRRDLLETAAEAAWFSHGFPASAVPADEAAGAAAVVRKVIAELTRLAEQLERRHQSVDLVRAIELYESGMSIRKTAEAVGMSFTQLRRRLVRAGVPIRPTGNARLASEP